MGRATEAEIALRVEAVRRLILSGASRYDVVQFSSKNWGITHRQGDDYIALARNAIMEASKRSLPEELAEAKQARRELRRKAADAKDYRLVLAIMQDEAKLLDLYPAQRFDISILRLEAERIALETGQPVEALLAEAEAIVQSAGKAR